MVLVPNWKELALLEPGVTLQSNHLWRRNGGIMTYTWLQGAYLCGCRGHNELGRTQKTSSDSYLQSTQKGQMRVHQNSYFITKEKKKMTSQL